MIYKGIPVEKPSDMTDSEAEQYLNQEYPSILAGLGNVRNMLISYDKDDVIIKGLQKSNIKRLARITGYLSEVQNFNSAKSEELKSRYKHL